MGKARPQFITVKRATKVKDDALYFVMKGGGYYRPKAEGYANDFADAGVWLGKDAKKYLQAEGVTLHPVKPMRQVIDLEMRHHVRRAYILSHLLELI